MGEKRKGVWPASASSIGIRFQLGGRQVREFIPVRPTAAALSAWGRRREVLIEEIKQDRFDYARWFPWSKRAAAAPSQATIATLLESWLRGAEKVLERTTIKKVGRDVNNVLLPTFGQIPAEQFHAGHIQDWIDGHNLARKTTSNYLWPLRQALARAVHVDRVLAEDPLVRYQVRRRRLDRERATPEPDPFEADELAALVAQAQNDLAIYIRFGAWTGLRPEEMLELHWQDVDTTVHHRAWVHRARVGGIVKGTKTASSDRYVTLLPEALQALQDAKALSWLAGGHVFLCARTAAPWSGEAVRLAMQRACRRAGVRYRPPSQLRHTFASRMLTAGEELPAIAREMGHKDVTETTRTYARLLKDLEGREFGGKAVAAYGKVLVK
jgi:integrase